MKSQFMKMMAAALAACCLFLAGAGQAHAQYNGKVDVQMFQHFDNGDYGLMDFIGARVGYFFTDNFSAGIGYETGMSAMKNNHATQLLGINLSHVQGTGKKTQLISSLVGGMMWDKNVQDNTFAKKPYIGVEEQIRFHLNSKSYIGLSARYNVAKDYIQGSFIGITIGCRF